MGDGGRPTRLVRGRDGVVPLGCQVEPVFARPCYTRLFRASIENPKSSARVKTWAEF